MEEELFFNGLVTKSLHPIQGDDRFFEGYLTVQVKDKQGEITIVDELIKVLPIWMDRGAPITDTHSNRVVGKGINYAKTVYKTDEGVEYPAIKITGKIHKNYELDNEIWQKITKGEYKGLSFGGATKADRDPIRMKDGSVAYSLKELEHYEVAVCADPAVPLALITDHNPLAKAMVQGTTEDRDGKMVSKCVKFGCYVRKVSIDRKDDDVTHNKKIVEDIATDETANPPVDAKEERLREMGFQTRRKPCKNCGDKEGLIEAKKPEDKDWTGAFNETRLEGGERKEICPNCNVKRITDDLAQRDPSSYGGKSKEKTNNITKPIPDGKGGKGDFEHCESKNQDKDDPSAFCGAIQHKLEKAVSEGRLESIEKNGLEFFATKEELNKVCSACGKTLAEHGLVKYDHSNSQGDQHSMYNQNTGRETWVGQGLPQPTVEGKDDNPTEKDLPINADSRLKKDEESKQSEEDMEKIIGEEYRTSGDKQIPLSRVDSPNFHAPLGVDVGEKRGRNDEEEHAIQHAFSIDHELAEELKSKAKMAKLKVTIMTTKTEENMIGAGQRGLGHDHGSIQGSGQSHQITEVKDDDKTVEKINALGRLIASMGKKPKKENDEGDEKKSGYVTEDGNKQAGDADRGDKSEK